MRNSIKNKEMSTFDNYIIILELGGLVSHDQIKNSNPI